MESLLECLAHNLSQPTYVQWLIYGTKREWFCSWICNYFSEMIPYEILRQIYIGHRSQIVFIEFIVVRKCQKIIY